MKHSNFNGQTRFSSFTEAHEYLATDIVNVEHQNQLKRALEYLFDAQDTDDLRPAGADIAHTLKNLGVDQHTLIATILSDPRLRDKLEQYIIEDKFDEPIIDLVHQVHWLNTFKDCQNVTNYVPEQAEALRQLLLASIDDVRAVLIKLAFRVQRLRNLYREEEKIQHCIAKETLEIYSPLANRLGIGELKWEMEDLAFRYLELEQYKTISSSMAEKRTWRENYIHNFVCEIDQLLQDEGIQAKSYGRPKHLYSIWKKMQRKNQQCHELADLLAVRILVDDVAQCYQVLGIVHGLWKHLPNEFDDYIANTKDNGYQSIHTAIIGPEQQIIEIQIRTHEMHEFSEHGVAAHWRYKEGSRQNLAMENAIASLRKILENRNDDDILLEDFKTELFSDHILVLTPDAEVIELQFNATALDFAYAIHTDIGNHCVGALVNGHRAPLSYALRSGEKIEILTEKNSEPSIKWLDYVKTSKAQACIKQWFNIKYKDYKNKLSVFTENLIGLGNHQVKLESCCNPKLGEPLLGQLMPDQSIILHQQLCTSLANPSSSNKIISLNWGECNGQQQIQIKIEAFDRRGLLNDITALLNHENLNVIRANTETDAIDQSVSMLLTMEIDQHGNLNRILKRLKLIPNVFLAEQLET